MAAVTVNGPVFEVAVAITLAMPAALVIAVPLDKVALTRRQLSRTRNDLGRSGHEIDGAAAQTEAR